MSNPRRRRNFELPQNWWIFPLIFILFLLTPTIVGGSKGDSSSGWWIALVCLIILGGLAVLAFRWLIPLLRKGISKGIAEVKSIDTRMSTYQRGATTSIAPYAQTQQVGQTDQAMISSAGAPSITITTIPNTAPFPSSTTGHMVQGRRAVQALPLPNQWEQLRKQLLFLGEDDAITKAAALTTTLIIEDPCTGRVAAGRLLFEQLLKKAGEVSICLVTASNKYNNLAEQFENVYLIGSPEAKRSLNASLQESYGGVDEHNIDNFCRTLVEEGDHAVMDLSTYADEGLAAQILLNAMYGIYSYTSANTNRQCILILDGADHLLPVDQRVGTGLFTNQGKAQGLKEDFIRLITTGVEIGLHTYMLTNHPTELDGRALLACRLWIINKPLTVKETALVCGRTRAGENEIRALHDEGRTLLTEDIGVSPVKTFLLRQCNTTHLEPTEAFHWGKPLQVQPRQQAKLTTTVGHSDTAQRVVQSQPLAETPTYQSTHIQQQIPLTSTTAQISTTTPLSAAQENGDSTANTQQAQKPKLSEYVCYTKLFLPQFYSPETLMRPPKGLMPLVEMLELAERYAQRGIVIGDYPVRAIMHRTEDVPVWAQQVANTVRQMVLDYQVQQQVEIDLEPNITPEQDTSMLNRNEANQVITQQQLLPAATENKADPSEEDGIDYVQSTWRLPGMMLLKESVKVTSAARPSRIYELAGVLRETLRAFKVDADVLDKDISIGPTVIRLGIRPTGKPEMVPDPKFPSDPRKRQINRDTEGNIVYETRTRVSKIMALQNDLALVLEAKMIRMEAPVPGRPFVGVEIPNKDSRLVMLREVLESNEYKAAKRKSKLAIALGKDVEGMVRVGDLSKMPHLLIAGATGAGKSVTVNGIIASIITQATPDDVRMLMIDPKMVELSMYNGIPHLLSPVVTEVAKVVPLLKNAISEMERRYRLFSQLNVRNLDGYRKLRLEKIAKGDTSLNNLPAIVIIIDELADLMMVAPEEVEGMICRLAQLARATGIHLVIATQRPSVDVITGLIKANIPTRISFMVSSQVDSRTIIDMGGAERLLGRGDMLYLPADAGRPERIQAAFLSDEEAHDLADYWRRQVIERAARLGINLQQQPTIEEGWELKEEPVEDAELDDELLYMAEELVRSHGRASISLLQRRLRIGYTRAARLIDLLEDRGVIGQFEARGRIREVYEIGREKSTTPTPNDLLDQEHYPDDEFEDNDDFEDNDEFEDDDEPQEQETTNADKVLTASETLALLLGENLGPLLPTLEQIAQGRRFSIDDGRNMTKETLQLLVATFAFQRGTVSKTTVETRFGVGFSKANDVIEYLEDMEIIRKYENNSKPRTLTENRGGDTLPALLRAVRDLVDSYQKPLIQPIGKEEDQTEPEVHTGELLPLTIKPSHGTSAE